MSARRSQPSGLPALAALGLLSRCLALGLVLGAGLSSCERAVPEPTVPELSPAVAERAAELQALLGAPLDAEPIARDDKRFAGLLGLVAGSAGDMRTVGLDDLLGLGPGVLTPLAAVAGDAEESDDRRVAALGTLDRAAIERTAELGPGVARAAVELLGAAREPWVRSRAAWIAGRAGTDGVLPDLVLRLKYETDGEVVVWIAWAAAQLGNFSGLDGLLAVAADASQAAAGLAANTGAELAAERGFESAYALAEAWRLDDERLRAEPRGEAYLAAVVHWIARLDEYQLRGVDDARFIFERLDRAAAFELARALFDESPHVRLHAAQSLGLMGRRAQVAVADLARALALPDVAPTAAEALGAVGYTPALIELEQRLAEQHSLELRVACARGIAKLGLVEALPALRTALRANDDSAAASPELGQALAEALSTCGAGAEAAPRLLDCIESPRLEPSTSLAALGSWLTRERDASQAGGDAHRAWSEYAERPEDLRPAVEALLAAMPR